MARGISWVAMKRVAGRTELKSKTPAGSLHYAITPAVAMFTSVFACGELTPKANAGR